MKKLRILIIVTIISIIAVVVTLVVVNINMKKATADEQNDYQNMLNNPEILITGEKPVREKVANIYFSVEASINKTIGYVKENNNVAVYNILEPKYITSRQITKENAIEISRLNKIEKCKMVDLYSISGAGYAMFYIKLVNQDNEYMYFNMNWDDNAQTYNLKPLSPAEYEEALNTPLDKESAKKITIANNDNNSIYNQYLSYEDTVKKYFLDYINGAIEFPEETYKNLDEEYKNARFGNVEEFKKYVKNNKELQNLYRVENLTLNDVTNYEEYFKIKEETGIEKYGITDKEGYKQYLYLDSYGNYYIFKVTGLMKYTLILDTYSIDIPEVTEKYDKGTDQEKVVININKFMLALNSKDYKYIYNVLDDGFKQNYFQTLEDFEKYAKAIFFEKNKFSYDTYESNDGAYHTYDIRIQDETGENKAQIMKKFIMKLEPNRKFRMSFNVK